MKDRSVEELRAIAISIGKPLETLLYDMLKDAMTENAKLKKQLKDTHLILIDYQDLEIRNKEYKVQQQEFINYLEKEIVDCKAGSGQQYYAQEHLKTFKEIIGGNKDENNKR